MYENSHYKIFTKTVTIISRKGFYSIFRTAEQTFSIAEHTSPTAEQTFPTAEQKMNTA